MRFLILIAAFSVTLTAMADHAGKKSNRDDRVMKRLAVVKPYESASEAQTAVKRAETLYQELMVLIQASGRRLDEKQIAEIHGSGGFSGSGLFYRGSGWMEIEGSEKMDLSQLQQYELKICPEALKKKAAEYRKIRDTTLKTEKSDQPILEDLSYRGRFNAEGKYRERTDAERKAAHKKYKALGRPLINRVWETWQADKIIDMMSNACDDASISDKLFEEEILKRQEGFAQTVDRLNVSRTQLNDEEKKQLDRMERNAKRTVVYFVKPVPTVSFQGMRYGQIRTALSNSSRTVDTTFGFWGTALKYQSQNIHLNFYQGEAKTKNVIDWSLGNPRSSRTLPSKYMKIKRDYFFLY